MNSTTARPLNVSYLVIGLENRLDDMPYVRRLL